MTEPRTFPPVKFNATVTNPTGLPHCKARNQYLYSPLARALKLSREDQLQFLSCFLFRALEIVFGNPMFIERRRVQKCTPATTAVVNENCKNRIENFFPPGLLTPLPAKTATGPERFQATT